MPVYPNYPKLSDRQGFRNRADPDFEKQCDPGLHYLLFALCGGITPLNLRVKLASARKFRNFTIHIYLCPFHNRYI